jgi:hypothetical protein
MGKLLVMELILWLFEDRSQLSGSRARRDSRRDIVPVVAHVATLPVPPTTIHFIDTVDTDERQ